MTAMSRNEKVSRRKRNAKNKTKMREDDLHIAVNYVLKSKHGHLRSSGLRTHCKMKV
jgi:hypothetical protein